METPEEKAGAEKEQKRFELMLDATQWSLTYEHAVQSIANQLLKGLTVRVDPGASAAFETVSVRAERHIAELEKLISELGEQPSTVRRTVAAGVGAALGFVDRVLPARGLLTTLRDGYIALNFAAAGYHVLYTRAILLEEPAAADVALRHLQDYTPLVRRFSQLLGWAAAFDLRSEATRSLGAADEITQVLEEAWSKRLASRPRGPDDEPARAKMLRSANELIGYRLEASDAEVGCCADLLIDDEGWAIRHVVVESGSWPDGRKVLVSPAALRDAGAGERRFALELTESQLEESPAFDADAEGADPHLRSLRELVGYRILAADGEIGHLEDLVVEDETWLVRYLVVNTRNWLPGARVLVAPAWVNHVDWADHRIGVELDRETVQHSPRYDPGAPVNRQYEARLYDYYGRPVYWE